jgi:hypothetical protein
MTLSLEHGQLDGNAWAIGADFQSQAVLSAVGIGYLLGQVGVELGDLLSFGDILLDCRYEYIWAEGFKEEVRPSGVQGGLLFTVPGGEEDHRNMSSGRIGLEAATGYDAPYAGHPHVHNDQSGPVGNGQGDGLLAVFGFEYLEITAALEAEAYQSANVCFVVYCYDHFSGH